MSSHERSLPRVCIAFPSGTMVHAGFAMALASLYQGCHAIPMRLANVRSSVIAIARNNAVEKAREFEAEYLFFVDSDMEFPATTLLRLLLHRQDIVGATYVRRTAPFEIIGCSIDPQPSSGPSGLVEMSRMPTGCLLIRMSVFDRIAQPYFRYGVDDGGRIVGEDFQFCDDVRRVGFRVWCDADLSRELIHIGERGFSLKVAEGYDATSSALETKGRLELHRAA